MLFNSWQYAVFLPLVVGFYWIVPHKARWILLLMASYYFYMSWNANLVVLILTTTITSYAAALFIARSSNLRAKKVWLILGVCISLAMLFYFKYFNFFSEGITALLRAISLPVGDGFIVKVMLPVGISFYTFQTLSYVIDVYRGKLAAEKHFGIYALYVSFFPQLVAGPIERATSLLPQFHVVHHPDAKQWATGLRVLCWGLFKKIAIADFVAGYVNIVYSDVNGCGPMAYVIATLLFAIQIYCDFSGYSDIARGSAAFMGFELMQNFNAPYFAHSVKEFWRRWHISLSGWFSDYVFIPLGGSRTKLPRHLANLMITFLLSGLWHGAKLTFVLWGVLHGLLIILDVFILPRREKLTATWHPWARHTVHMFETVLTFSLVCVAWTFFRADNLADVFTILSRLPWALSAPMQGVTVALSTMGITTAALIRILLCVLALACHDWIQRQKGDPFAILATKKAPVRIFISYILAFCVLFAILTLPENVVVEFIYFQF